MAIRKQMRSIARLSGALLVAAGLVVSGGTLVQAADDTEKTIASLTLTKNLDIDRKLNPYRDPVLIRIKARVAPAWRGPLGEPPWTEHRNCVKVDLISPNDFPHFC